MCVLRSCLRWQIRLVTCATRQLAGRLAHVRRHGWWASAFGVALCLACEPHVAVPGPADGSLLVLVSNEVSNDISFIDSASDAVVRSVPVGKRPRGMKVSPDGRKLYVALTGSPRGGPNVDESTLPPPDRAADGIGVLDLESATPQTRLSSGNDPETIDTSPDGRVLAVANEDSAQVRLMDSKSAQVLADIPVGLEPEGVRFRPDGRYVYVTAEASDRIDVISVEELRVIATIPTGHRPRNVVFSPDSERAYVACEFAGRIDVLDAREHRAFTSVEIEGPPQPLPMGMALDEAEHRLYVTLGREGGVAVIDTRALRLVQRIANVGARPWGIALTPDGSKIYTANGPSGDVSVIDTKSLQVVRRIPVGKQPWGISLVRVRGN